MNTVKFLLLAALLCPAAHAVTTRRVSTTSNDVEATGGNSFASAVSGNGRLVAFSSLATNLDPADGNTLNDIYLKDTQTGQLTLVSRGANGVGNASSNLPQLSADGRFVAFVSAASNLVANDTNGTSDVFVYTVSTGALEIVSVSSTGAQANGASGAGSCGGNCFSLSADGRFVAFESLATNLAALDIDTASDIFLRDRQTGTTTLVSQTSAGQLGSGSIGSNRPAISGNGQFVVFESSRVLEASDTNNTGDIYLRNLSAGTTVRVNTSATGAFTTSGFSARPSINNDGTIVAFRSVSNELVPNDNTSTTQRDIFVKNVSTGAIQRVQAPAVEPNGDSNELSLSGDGAVLYFHSAATNLIADDTNAVEDIFKRTVATGAIERVSLSTTGTQGSGASLFPKSNNDGTVVTFESSAANLVVSDTNARTDVFATVVDSDSLFANGFE
jgi:hypothetical protein